MGLFSSRKDEARTEFERGALTHLDSLYATALRLTGKPSDAEDLVQDAFVRALRYYDRFEAGTNLRAWLLRILTNTFINRYRRSMRERAAFDGMNNDASLEGVTHSAALRVLTNPHDAATASRLSAEIEAALSELPEDYRIVVVLSDIEELSYREIAEVLGCPIGTVMSRLHRARRSMQKRLLTQARELGWIKDEEASSEQPISLEAFRRLRGAK